MSDEKPKPLPWRGHNLARALTTLEILLTTKKKTVLLGRIVRSDESRKQWQERYEKQGW